MCNVTPTGNRDWQNIADTQPIALTIESKLCEILVTDVFTSLDAAQLKACTIDSKLDTAISAANDDSLDFSGIFTSLDNLNEKIDILQSKTNLLDMSVSSIEGSFGIAIRNSNVGPTGLTLVNPGTYFLAEDINYAPSGTGTAAITINGDNIALNLNGRTIRQTNSETATIGVEVTNGRTNTQILNGVIKDTTDSGIYINSNNSNIAIGNIALRDNSSNSLIEISSGSSNISLDYVTTINAAANGVNCTSITGINVTNSIFTSNTARGFLISTSSLISIINCICNDNGDTGIDIFDANNTFEVINNTTTNNGNVGIRIRNNSLDGVIKNCYCANNTSDGIRVALNSERIKFIENYLDNNGRYNISLQSGTDNCYIFGNCMILSTSVNLREDATSGPNSVLGNYALATTFADNYVTLSGNTNFNLDEFDQSGAFPSPAPTSWKNMSVRT
jgi:hypothetical protein